MKLKDFAIGDTFTISLLVVSAMARETRAKKPYLQLKLFDGITSIDGNYWDWRGVNIPSKNTILDITAKMTEYLGKPQLNVKSMSVNKTLHINEFTPSSGLDVGSIYKEAYSLMAEVKDDYLRNLSLTILDHLRPLWVTAPGAVVIHHAYAAGNLIHCLSVAKLSRLMAEEVGACVELATVGGFLHDIGKLFGYRINGAVCEMTDEGLLCEHTFLGARFVSNFTDELYPEDPDNVGDKCELLTHIILSHHGIGEHGAAVPPQSLEAHIVHLADCVDAKAEQVKAESAKLEDTKWTERIWALENRQHITTQYTTAVFNSTK